MNQEYVTKTDGAYRVGATRVSLDSLVYLFREGMSAESMVDSYPAFTLEQVHGGGVARAGGSGHFADRSNRNRD